jgi:hypothetical protein
VILVCSVVDGRTPGSTADVEKWGLLSSLIGRLELVSACVAHPVHPNQRPSLPFCHLPLSSVKTNPSQRDQRASDIFDEQKIEARASFTPFRFTLSLSSSYASGTTTHVTREKFSLAQPLFDYLYSLFAFTFFLPPSRFSMRDQATSRAKTDPLRGHPQPKALASFEYSGTFCEVVGLMGAPQ